MRGSTLALALILAGTALLAGTAHSRPADDTVDQIIRQRRAVEVLTVDETLVVHGLQTPGRRTRLLDRITAGDWEITGPLTVDWRGRGRRQVVEVSGQAQVRWRGLDLGAGPLILQREDDDWTGTWASTGGAVDLRITWQPDFEPQAPAGASPDDAPVAEPAPYADIVISAQAPDLKGIATHWLADTLFASLGGSARVECALGTAEDQLTGTVSLHAIPTLKGQLVGDLLVDARRVAGGQPTLEAALAGPMGKIDAQGVWPSARDDMLALSPTAPLQFDARLQSVKLDQLTKIWPALALKGRSYGSVSLEGTARRPRLKSSVLTAGLAWRGETLGRFVVGLAFYDGQFVPSINWDGHTTLNGTVPGRLDLDRGTAEWDHTRPLDLSLIAKGITPQRLRPFWRAHPAADFTLDLDLRAAESLKRFELRGALTGELRRRGKDPVPLKASILGDGKRQQVNVAVGTDVWQGAWTTRAPLHAIRVGNARWDETRVQGNMSINLPLPMLAPYLPAGFFDPQGRLSGTLTTAGTLRDPDLNGTVALKDGALTLTDLAQRLVDIQAEGSIRAGTLTVSDLQAHSGIGSLTGQGSVTLKATPRDAPADLPLWSDWRLGIAVQFIADRFPFIHDSLPNGTLDTDVTIDGLMRPGDTRARLALRGTTVHLTPIRMPSADAIPQHRAVRTLDWRGAVQEAPSVFAGTGRLEVEAVLHDPIYVEGDGVDMHLEGALTIRRNGNQASTDGGFTARPGGTFELFDNPFVIVGGGMRMQGGDLQRVIEVTAGHAMLRDPDRKIEARALEPIIELRAQSKVVDTEVIVAVNGPARRPELILESDPPLPEYRLLTLLITGRVDAVDERGGDVRRQVAKLVSRFHNPSLSRQLYDRLGVDKLGLKFGSSVTNPILTVGKQIDRQLYLETVYHHDAPPDENEKEVHLEYRLDPRWTLDTVYGDAAKGSLGLFWKTTFGRRSPPRSATKTPAK